MVELYFGFKFWGKVIALGLVVILTVFWILWINYCEKNR